MMLLEGQVCFPLSYGFSVANKTVS
jgi:hypothetical protein